MPVERSGAADFSSEICGHVGLFFHLHQLRWLEREASRRSTSSINKVGVPGLLVKQMYKGELLPPTGYGGEGVEQPTSMSSPSRRRRSWRLRDLMRCHGISLSLASFLVEPPRWWRDAGTEADEVFFLFNKWMFSLLWFCWIWHLLLPPLAGHDGLTRDSKLESICSIRGGGGVQELINVGGMMAFTILCRHGGSFLTSGEEALFRPGCGCSKPLEREVIRSPRTRGGPQLLVVAGKELPSKNLRFLGGFALRNPANGGGDARGLDCFFFFCPRVFCIKRINILIHR
jgi:hypothetical protein